MTIVQKLTRKLIKLLLSTDTKLKQDFWVEIQAQFLKDEYKALFINFMAHNNAEVLLEATLNDLDLLLPIEMLKTYAHCFEYTKRHKLNFEVEVSNVQWLRSNLNEGDIFFDIGAAFGAVSLPVSQIVGAKGQIIAFDPARQTQKLLEKIVEVNNLKNIRLVNLAIADHTGNADFVEYTLDNKEFNWASDTSSLMSSQVCLQHEHNTYKVKVTTIDQFVTDTGIIPKAIKIDIEGFEVYALHGAKSTLKQYFPLLCIDIHQDAKTGESSRFEVEKFLTGIGYYTEIKDYHLYAIRS